MLKVKQLIIIMFSILLISENQRRGLFGFNINYSPEKVLG